MNKTETIQKIKVLLGMETEVKVEPVVEPVIVEVVMTEAKLKDGTVIVFDNLEVGGKFLLKQDAQTSTPAPAGEYEMEDGSIVVVGPDNLITEIKPPIAAADQTIQPTPETAPIIPAPEITLESLFTMIQDLNTRLTACEGMMGDMGSGMVDMKAQFSTQLEEIAKQPAGEPVHFSTQHTEEKELTSADLILKKLNMAEKFYKR